MHTALQDMVMVRNKSGPLLIDWINLDCSKNIFRQYLKAVIAEDIAPAHGAVVAVDSMITVSARLGSARAHMQVQRAFVILLDAEPIECRVLVWHAESECYIGALTLTDLIGAIHHAKDDYTFVTKSLMWLIHERARVCSQPVQLITANANSS
jgi:hypothetical protein